MSVLITILLFTLIIFLANAIQVITGFAGTVLAMPFCIMLVGVETSKQVLNILGILACLWIVFISYKNIVWKEYFKIASIMAIGLIIGIILYKHFPMPILLKILPIFIIFVAVRGLFVMNKELKALPNWTANIILVSAGIIHGMFIVGGPLLVIYATEKLKSKAQFRATLSLVWVTLNSFVAIEGIANGGINSEVLKYLGIAIIGLLGGMILGNNLYHKMSQKVFMKLTYVLLLISGISILV